MQVGDYVRTKNGYIGKTIVVTEYNVNIEDKIVVEIKDIIKSAEPTPEGLLSLIQGGDYVNGAEVMDADWFDEAGEYEEGLAFPLYSEDDLHVIVNWLPLRCVEINSIVTKEQFEAMEYKVGVDKE